MICKTIHPWNVSFKEAVRIQERLRKKVIVLFKKEYPIDCDRIKIIAAADVSFSKETSKATAAVVIFKFPDLKIIEKVIISSDVSFPYIPGLLSFREAPILIKAFKKLNTNADLILFDGQGVCHPRRMGIATHMGIILDRPTIGCAKTYLYGNFKEPPNSRGSFSLIKDKKTDEILAVALRTKHNVKPIFVSVGYKIDLKTAIKIALLMSKYRIPEPLRLAHHYAKMVA